MRFSARGRGRPSGSAHELVHAVIDRETGVDVPARVDANAVHMAALETCEHLALTVATVEGHYAALGQHWENELTKLLEPLRVHVNLYNAEGENVPRICEEFSVLLYP